MNEWVRCDVRMPGIDDSENGYFWCWGPTFDGVALLESWGDGEGVPAKGFCHEASGIVTGVTHWQPATPPASPIQDDGQHGTGTGD